MDYDVIFLGSGHSCNHGGMALAMSGKKVAFVEMGKMGGTCTNYGCDAKILLDSPFEHIDGLQNYQGLCVEAEYIVIGSGQRNFILDIPGKEYLHDSRDFLDVDEFPERLVIIGTGIIAMEFASIALKLGRKVDLIARGSDVLRNYPQAYVKKLVADMECEGAVFHYGESTTSVEKTQDGLVVRTAGGSALACDYVLNAAGRVANFEGMGLDALGIKASARGIKVDDHMRTSVSNIFASGDCVEKRIPKLTPTAAFESDYIATQILGVNPNPIQYPAIPNLVFTLPRIAQTGVSVEEAEAHPEQYRIARVPYGQMMLWNARNEADVDITYIFDKQNLLVGAAIYGSDAGAWIDVLTIIINCKLNAMALGSMIFAFPTSTYGLINTLLPQMMVPPQQ